jgi:hypothetical protein
MRTIGRLVAALVLCGIAGAPLHAQSPASVFNALSGAIDRRDWDSAAATLYPPSLERLRVVVVRLLVDGLRRGGIDTTTVNGYWRPQVDTTGLDTVALRPYWNRVVEDLSGKPTIGQLVSERATQFGARIIARMGTCEFLVSHGHAFGDIVENDSIAHVLYTTSPPLPRPDWFASREVVRRFGSRWYVPFDHWRAILMLLWGPGSRDLCVTTPS